MSKSGTEPSPKRAPATLDLVERGRLAINALTGGVAPEHWYAVWQNLQVDAVPPTLSGASLMQYKYLEALAGLRTMTDSDHNISVDDAMMASVLNRHADDGLVYAPPKNAAVQFEAPLATASHIMNSRMILTMSAWYSRDRDPAWLERIARIAQGLSRIAIRRSFGGRERYAFFPTEAGCTPNGTWVGSAAEDSELPLPGRDYRFFPYTTPDEPAREQQGREGTILSDQGNVVRGMMECYRLTNDQHALDLARKVTTYCTLPSMWDESYQWGVQGHESGVWAGHFHGHVLAFRGLLDVAMATGDEDLKNLVKAAYEHGCRVGLRRLGWFPAWVAPERFGRPRELQSISENCGIHDMIALAISLSDAGLGDYWDDVDHFARNQLVEHQLVDRQQLERVAERARSVSTEPGAPQTSPFDSSEDALARMIGAFGEGTPAVIGPVTGVSAAGCCTGNGALSLYQVWDAIARHRSGVTTINLLLDRRSPWVDVRSWLPAEGRVQVTANTATDLALRIPGWVSLTDVHVTVDSAPQEPSYAGRYLTLRGAGPGQVVELTFPVPTSRVDYQVLGTTYSCEFRGSTAIAVRSSADDTTANQYALYQRSGEK